MIDHPVFRRFAPYRKDHEDWLGAKFAVNHREGQPGLDEGLFEWMSMLQAVLRADQRFVMLELGAGFGRWGIFAALAAKAVGIPDIRVSLIEAEPQHARWAAESVRLNGLEREVTLIEAAISNNSERVLFMIDPAKTYDEAFKFGGAVANDDAVASSSSSNTYFGYPVYRVGGNEQIYVPAVTLGEVMEGLDRVDLIDADLQGAEAELLDWMDLLTSKVRMIHLGTHSVEVEAALRNAFQRWGWICQWDFSLMGERQTPFGPVNFGDGVQTWINPELYHGASSEPEAPSAADAGGTNELEALVKKLQDSLSGVQAVALATADRLETLQAQYDVLCERIDTLTKGVETWLLPTLARHDAAIARRHPLLRPLGATLGSLVKRWVGN